MMAKSTQSIIPEILVANKIYEIRGQKVMLDSDLAELYNSETKRLNEQVGRNRDRFPPDFMFQLTEEEWESLRSQFATSKIGKGGRRYMPFVFTEHGVLMLSSVLSSKQAIQVNIQIVRVFTKLRALLGEHADLKVEISDIKKQLQNHDKNIELVFSYIDELTEKKAKPRRRIGYKPDDL